MVVELPPDIPVISSCAEATLVGWQQSQQCLLKQGFRAASASKRLEQIELDYWTAIGLLNGKSVEQAVPQGDRKQTLKWAGLDGVVELEMTELESPFLLVDAPAEPSLKNESIHKVYSRDDGLVAVLLDDKASTSLQVFGSDRWEPFLDLMADLSSTEATINESAAVKQIEVDPIEEPGLLADLFYRVFPSSYPDTPSWSITQTSSPEFSDLLNRPSEFTFSATYTVTRQY